MCDVKKYSRMFQDIKQLQPEDTLQLVLEAESQEEQDFLKWLVIFCFRENRSRLLKGIFFDEEIYTDCRR